MRQLLFAVATGGALIVTPAAAQTTVYAGEAPAYGVFGAYVGPPAYRTYGYSGVWAYAPTYGYASSYRRAYGYEDSYAVAPYGRSAPRRYYGGPKWDW